MATRTLGMFWLFRGVVNELAHALVAGASELGIQARRIEALDDDAAVDDVLVINLLESHKLPPRRRARRVLWFGEPLPSATSNTGRVLRAFPSGRTLDAVTRALPERATPSALLELRARAGAEREPVRNLRAVWRAAKAIDGLAINSEPNEQFDGYPVPVIRAIWGYHPVLDGPFVDPAAQRDIDVLMLATRWDPRGRRELILDRVVPALAPDVQVLRLERDVLGETRQALLARARIVLDVHRIPGNFAGLRLAMSIAAGAVVVSEPYDDPAPYVPGTHYEEAPVDQLATAVRALLRDEDRRRQIVRAGQELLAGPASLTRNLALIMEKLFP